MAVPVFQFGFGWSLRMALGLSGSIASTLLVVICTIGGVFLPSQNTAFGENFQGGLPPDWEIVDNLSGGGAVWGWYENHEDPSVEAYVGVNPSLDSDHDMSDTWLVSPAIDLDGWNWIELWLWYAFDDEESTVSADVAIGFPEVAGSGWESVHVAQPDIDDIIRVQLWTGAPPYDLDQLEVQFAFRFKNTEANRGYWDLFSVVLDGSEESEVGTDDDDDSLEDDDVGNVDDDDNVNASCCGC
ncbi:MAG: choice-of-anchor J domain-containing protein [Deltaproteobacteria bacterium]|nr:choice-of-anchor J domain-containing protein [Deltaproteobacteria bacterium]